MKKIDRYIGQNVLGGVFLVLTTLVGLFAFFSFIEEVDDIGKHNYGLWQAVEYVLLEIPQNIYDLFPTASLLGSLIGLGLLVNNNELTVLRAAGVSIGRIALAVLKMSLILTFISMLIGETLAPRSDQYAEKFRAIAQSEQQRMAFDRRYGFWARDGNHFINIRSILSNGGFEAISLYKLDKTQRLQTFIFAKTAYYWDNQWLLEDVEKTTISNTEVKREFLKNMTWKAVLNPDLVKIVDIRPENLSSLGLYKYIQYLKDNNRRSAEQELAFWKRLSYPLVSTVMVLLAIPFVFGSSRSVTIGQRILVGALWGIGFFMLNQIVTNFGLVYNISPILSAFLPPLLFLGFTLFLLKRVV